MVKDGINVGFGHLIGDYHLANGRGNNKKNTASHRLFIGAEKLFDIRRFQVTREFLWAGHTAAADS